MKQAVKVRIVDNVEFKSASGEVTPLKGYTGELLQLFSSTLIIEIPELSDLPFLLNDSAAKSFEFLNSN